MSLRDLENETAEAVLNRIKELAPLTQLDTLADLANAYAAIVSHAPDPMPARPSRVSSAPAKLG
jgi:2-methylisocitrate lyase-like PEP mutase family enzyme